MTLHREKKRIAYEYATAIGLLTLCVASVVITVILAIRGNTRLPWMVAVSLLLLFLTAFNHIRIKMTFKSMQKNLRLRRKIHATRGTILRFPSPSESMPQREEEE